MTEIKTTCSVCHNKITIHFIEIVRGHVYLHDTFKAANGDPIKVKVTRIGQSPKQPSFDLAYRIVTPKRLLTGLFKERPLFYTSLDHAQLNWRETEKGK